MKLSFTFPKTKPVSESQQHNSAENTEGPVKTRPNKKPIPKNSVQKLIGMEKIQDGIVKSKRAEFVFFTIEPVNVSVLSYDNIEVKIKEFMTLLTTFPDLEIYCTDSSESFDENKAYLKGREESEFNRNIAKLIHLDFLHLDSIESETVSARQFVFIYRVQNNTKEEQKLQKINKVEKTISDSKFEVRRMSKDEIKHFLALYFNATVFGEQIPDIDGAQYIEPLENE